MAEELKRGDRVLQTNDGYVNYRHKGVVEKVEDTMVTIKWDLGSPYPENQRWNASSFSVFKVIDWFEEGDKVRLRDDVDREKLEEIGFDDSSVMDHLLEGAEGEFVAYGSETDLPVEAKFGFEGSQGVYYFEPGMLRHVFRKGDKVLVRDDAVGIADMLDNNVPQGAIDAVKGKVVEVLQSDGDKHVQLTCGTKGTWWFRVTTSVVSPTPAHLEQAEAGWDPMTEPINVGDLVEIVYDNEWKGKKGRVVMAEDPSEGAWAIKDDEGKWIGSANGRWGNRKSLKLLEKADGASGKAKQEEPPPPAFAQGDEVRILCTTKEMTDLGFDVVQAARLAKKVGKVVHVDTIEPKWLVDVPNVGASWMRTEKIEKVSA